MPRLAEPAILEQLEALREETKTEIEEELAKEKEARKRANEAAAAAAAAPERRDLQVLANARSSEAKSAESLVSLVGRTEGSVQVLVAQLNDAVNRAIELAFTAPAPETLDDLVMQLEALSFAITQRAGA